MLLFNLTPAPSDAAIGSIIFSTSICFMSSNTWDVSGGGVFGYNAVWVNRLNKVFDKLSYKPKNVINNLKELLEII